MSKDKISIHIDKADFEPPKPNGCPHKNTDLGYGLAGGGRGIYTYCLDCGQVIDKTQDSDE